jgi:phage pi2 protein 07
MKVSVCFPEEDVLAKQVADQMIKKYPAVIWTRMFITMLTKVNQHTGALPAQVVKTWNV